MGQEKNDGRGNNLSVEGQQDAAADGLMALGSVPSPPAQNENITNAELLSKVDDACGKETDDVPMVDTEAHDIPHANADHDASFHANADKVGDHAAGSMPTQNEGQPPVSKTSM